jgi:hypothetical protein
MKLVTTSAKAIEFIFLIASVFGMCYGIKHDDYLAGLMSLIVVLIFVRDKE